MENRFTALPQTLVSCTTHLLTSTSSYRPALTSSYIFYFEIFWFQFRRDIWCVETYMFIVSCYKLMIALNCNVFIWIVLKKQNIKSVVPCFHILHSCSTALDLQCTGLHNTSWWSAVCYSMLLYFSFFAFKTTWILLFYMSLWKIFFRVLQKVQDVKFLEFGYVYVNILHKFCSPLHCYVFTISNRFPDLSPFVFETDRCFRIRKENWKVFQRIQGDCCCWITTEMDFKFGL